MHSLSNLRPSAIVLLALLFAVALPGQGTETKPAKNQGLSWDVAEQGVKLKLPFAGWKENTKKDEVLGAYFDHVESGENDVSNTTLLSLGVFSALTVGPSMAGVIKTFQADPKQYADLKLKDGQKIGGTKDAFLLTWRAIDPRHPSAPKLNSMYLWTVDGRLYQWIERVPKAHYAAARKMLATARRNLRITGPKGAIHFPKTHKYVNQKVSYTLPKGWRWMRGSKGEKVKTDEVLVDQMVYEYAHGLSVVMVLAQIAAQAKVDTKGRLLDYHAGFADGVLKSYSDPKDAKAQKSARVAGKKGCRTWLTAKVAGARHALAFASFFHNDLLIHFMVSGDTVGGNKTRKAIMGAEKGLKTY